MTSIAELGIKVDSTDAAQASSDLDKLTAAGGRAEKAAERVSKGADKATESFKKQKDELADLLGEIDPTVKALGRLDELETKLAKHKGVGLDAATFSEYQAKIDQSRTNLTKFDDSLARTGNTAKQTAAALRGVPAQFTDIAVSLQGGQAPLTVFLQQGGQLKDMFGGIGPAAQALGGYVLGLINPFTVAAAAVGVLGYAYYKGSEEAVKYGEALILTGNAAGTTVDQLGQLAKQVASTVGTTGAASEVLVQLAASGKIASGSFEGVATAALEMEKATGRAVEETIAEFVKIGKDPVAAAKELNEQYHFLTATTYAQIVAMKEQGDTIGASKLLTDTYVDTIKNRSGEVIGNLSAWERGWKSLKGEISATADAVKNVGRDQSLTSQITEARQRVAAAQSAVNGMPSDTDAQAKLTNSRLELQFLTQQFDTQDAIAKAQALNSKNQESAILAITKVDALEKSSRTNAEKRADALKEYQKSLDAIRKVDPNDDRLKTQNVEKIKANIAEQFKDPKASAGSVDLTGFNDAQNQLKSVLGYYQNIEKELDSAQKAGLVSAESYSSQRVALVEQERVEVAAAYESEIAALEATKGKASTSAAQRIQLDQKIADARANMVKAQQEADTELEVLANAETGRLAKQQLAISNYTDALTRQNEALQRAGERAATGVGQGDRQASLNGSLDGIADRANQQRLDLARDKADASRNMSAEEYQKKLEAINQSESDLTETTLKNYDKMSEAQGSWSNGATSAFSNYLDSARDVAGQTKSLFTNAFTGMEDAIVNFALTGKLSFADFAKSILADMARIAARQASSAALSSLFGMAASAAGSYFGGGASSAGSTQAGYTGSDYSNWAATQANGGAWNSGVQMFANGAAFSNSIVSNPTAFGMAGGKTGVMGEAGPEAIMPLTRTAGGQLGVRALGGSSGGSSSNTYNFPVAVSVQVPEDQAQTTQTDSAAMGKAIQSVAKTEAEQAISRSTQPGGRIWKILNNQG